ncbi:Sec-independent protein translocase protein TatB [Pelagibacteraceae bacterium]|nr:Sec-independent protein translocase protein TatB [Pelagibacteraceae bacterium]
MPQIGWVELLLIVIIAILVIGPKDFPIVLKKIGSWTGSIKRYFSEVQSSVSQITEEDIEEDKKELKKNKDDE